MNENSRNSNFVYAYVGCRTSIKRNARGKGINVYKINCSTGKWTHIQLVKDLINPSFLTFDRENNYLYSVHGDCKEVSAFRTDHGSGKLNFLQSQQTGKDFIHSGLDPTRGYNPVHVAVDPGNRYIIVANHATGNITVHPRNKDGTVGPYLTIIHVAGMPVGPDEEPSFSRPHQICFDATGKFIIVPAQGRTQGNGMDKVLVYRFNDITGALIEICSIAARQRSWPRHGAFHKNNRFYYVINEIDNTVTSYYFDAKTGSLNAFQILSSLPETYTGDGQASEIIVHPSGKFLYASNRIHDSIAIFSIDQVTGMLSHNGWESSLGRTPRFTTIDPSGRYFYSANEDSDEIIQFSINQENGTLTPTGQKIQTESPVCIIFS